jgi:hypothetical protein
MKVVGVSTTYPAAALQDADAVYAGLDAVTLEEIEKSFRK